jgi:uncharacterized membrane protein YdjX (TVP38/TMEM64 family)
LVACAVYFLLFTKSGIRLTHCNVKQLAEYLRSLGNFALVIGMLAVFIQTLVPVVPFVLVAGANVLAFGLMWGFLINYGISCLAAVCAFFFARYYGHAWVERKIGNRSFVTAFNKKLESEGYLYVMLGRLVPVIPSTFINLGAGLSRIRFRQFLIGTMIGKFPMVYLESTIAHDLLHIRQYRGRLLVYLFIFVFLLFLGRVLKKRIFGDST